MGSCLVTTPLITIARTVGDNRSLQRYLQKSGQEVEVVLKVEPTRSGDFRC